MSDIVQTRLVISDHGGRVLTTELRQPWGVLTMESNIVRKGDITDGKVADETMGAKNHCSEMAIAVGLFSRHAATTIPVVAS